MLLFQNYTMRGNWIDLKCSVPNIFTNLQPSKNQSPIEDLGQARMLDNPEQSSLYQILNRDARRKRRQLCQLKFYLWFLYLCLYFDLYLRVTKRKKERRTSSYMSCFLNTCKKISSYLPHECDHRVRGKIDDLGQLITDATKQLDASAG